MRINNSASKRMTAIGWTSVSATRLSNYAIYQNKRRVDDDSWQANQNHEFHELFMKKKKSDSLLLLVEWYSEFRMQAGNQALQNKMFPLAERIMCLPFCNSLALQVWNGYRLINLHNMLSMNFWWRFLV